MFIDIAVLKVDSDANTYLTTNILFSAFGDPSTYHLIACLLDGKFVILWAYKYQGIYAVAPLAVTHFNWPKPEDVDYERPHKLIFFATETELAAYGIRTVAYSNTQSINLYGYRQAATGGYYSTLYSVIGANDQYASLYAIKQETRKDSNGNTRNRAIGVGYIIRSSVNHCVVFEIDAQRDLQSQTYLDKFEYMYAIDRPDGYHFIDVAFTTMYGDATEESTMVALDDNPGFGSNTDIKQSLYLIPRCKTGSCN